MLQIQRASAGSGKTFALAQNYILHLIAVRENGRYRLREEKEIENALQEILAITFTNKATNEMKERIIEKLSALSEAVVDANLTEDFINNTDYLRDLSEKTGADYKRIGEKCLFALKCILNKYSQFHISTIDSFFQEILRNFTYEVNLNDTYQIEIDSEFVSKNAVDTTLMELDNNSETSPSIKFWLNILMEEEVKKSQRWNVFSKSESANSIYTRIKSALIKLESEEYKSVKESLDRYFAQENSAEELRKLFINLRKEAKDERRKALNEIQKMRNEISEYIDANILPDSLYVNFTNQLEKIKDMKPEGSVPFQFDSLWKKKSVTKVKKVTPATTILDGMAMDMYSKLIDWDDPAKFPKTKAWEIYGELLPYLGLILEVNIYLSEILRKDNLIRISDTSALLKRIIGEDEAPFVYERIGSRIQNYLIDEFQDTSRMQWNVIKPLLSESLAWDNDSLIIGDPKQSIYRFRNADHNLIIRDVPELFPSHKAKGNNREENSNWRSHEKIVNFNNFFFKSLSEELYKISQEVGNSYDYINLYSNVVQTPSKKDGKGYIEIRLIEKESSNSGTEEGEDSSETESGDFDINLHQLGALITELIERGYKQKDIGILVNTNERGKKVVDYLLYYNESIKDPRKTIHFISEESLTISSSTAVELILSVFRKLVNGDIWKNRHSESSENQEKDGRLNWNKERVNYFYYKMQHPELSGAESLTRFVFDEERDEKLINLLKNLETPSLSAIVEIVIDNLISKDIVKKELIYIAAFQDIISEYSSHFNNDPASFLEWWESKGKRRSISTPAGTDAVQIMTIHKSKGLEFKCVIIPYATDNFLPSTKKTEWRWIKPELIEEKENLPPYLPVTTSGKLKGTCHESLYKNYVDQNITDKLNMYYVAFTRARNELYVLCTHSKRNSNTIDSFLDNILKESQDYFKNFTAEEKSLMINEEEICLETKDDGNIIIEIGKKLTEDEIKSEYKKDTKDKETEKNSDKTIQSYYVNKKRPRLYYKASRENDVVE